MRWERGRGRRRAGGHLRLILVLAALMLVACLCALARSGAIAWPSSRVLAWLGSKAQATGDGARDDAREVSEHVASEFLMDTYVSIRAYGASAEEAVDAAFAEMRRIEALTSRFVPDSDVSRLNRAAGGDAVAVSEETYALLEKARTCSEASGGAFDVTIGPVVDAWGFGGGDPRVPDRDTLRVAASLVNWRALELDPAARTARLAVRGMSVDLGGIAKGYAADRAGAVLRAHGVEHALIDAGGNIVAVGARPDGTPWRVGVRDPRGESPTDTIGPVIEAVDEAVVTSGDYERFFVQDGVRYHHIFDPATGAPARRAQSATVIAKDSCDADMLSTAVFVLGPERGIELVDGLGDRASAMVVDAGGKVMYSARFPRR